METRKQFTFYASFAEAIGRIKKKSDRADAYDAIIRYALYGEEPDLDALPDAAAIAFVSARPNLDASRRKAESGKAGGTRKQTGSKPEANQKRENPAREKEKEKEKEIEIEYECTPPSPPHAENKSNAPSGGGGGAVSELESILGPLTDGLRARLSRYSGMEPACIQRAADIAFRNGKSWNYALAILDRRMAAGVRTLEDWDNNERRQPAGFDERADALRALHDAFRGDET